MSLLNGTKVVDYKRFTTGDKVKYGDQYGTVRGMVGYDEYAVVDAQNNTKYMRGYELTKIDKLPNE